MAALSRAVTSREGSRGGPHDERSGGTLGDLLYADRATVASEEEWHTIVRAIASRDAHALHALYQRAHRLVFTLIVRITNDREIAEDVTLDVFHDVWRRAGTYDGAGGTVVGWIMNQARSRAIDRLRFEHRKKRIAALRDAAETEAMATDPQRAVGIRDRIRWLMDALATLTPSERRAIEAAFFSGRTYAEVAAHLDQPPGTVKTRIRAGLGKLRQALAQTERMP
jgi:RNA polymerase sigma-70 factor (ECF subfamily)